MGRYVTGLMIAMKDEIQADELGIALLICYTHHLGEVRAVIPFRIVFLDPLQSKTIHYLETRSRSLFLQRIVNSQIKPKKVVNGQSKALLVLQVLPVPLV